MWKKNMNDAWECPRCKRINAPFNPVCFCQPDEIKEVKLSNHAMDAANYLSGKNITSTPFKPSSTFTPLCGECLECGGIHFNGVQCRSL